jgi:DNA-binding response OmpR family regulator
MNIFIVYGSWYIGALINDFLSRLECVHIIGESRQSGTAVQMIKEKMPQIVIIDVELSDGKWKDILRQSKELSNIPLIIMTATSRFPQYRRLCLTAGADYFFEIPMEINELYTTVIKCAERASCANVKEK